MGLWEESLTYGLSITDKRRDQVRWSATTEADSRISRPERLYRGWQIDPGPEDWNLGKSCSTDETKGRNKWREMARKLLNNIGGKTTIALFGCQGGKQRRRTQSWMCMSFINTFQSFTTTRKQERIPIQMFSADYAEKLRRVYLTSYRNGWKIASQIIWRRSRSMDRFGGSCRGNSRATKWPSTLSLWTYLEGILRMSARQWKHWLVGEERKS